MTIFSKNRMTTINSNSNGKTAAKNRGFSYIWGMDGWAFLGRPV